jgi:hypothetical protein
MLKLLREERGSAIVIMAFAITMMMGFGALTVDLGNLYLNKTRLANMADAAALAGVQDLPDDPQGAVSNSYAYAGKNGLSSDIVEVTLSSNNTVVTVNATRHVPLYFAQIFDLTISDVSAQASAAIRAISGTTGVVPFGIVQQQFIYGQTYTLKAGAGGGYSGNYGALALGGNGANEYRDNIENGYNGQLRMGDWVSTEPGNMSGPTSQGVNYRIALDPNATFATVQQGSPRILVVPIIDSLAVHGRSDVLIVGFGAFFLEGVGGQGNNNYVSGKFMQIVIPGEMSSGAGDYGVYGSTLIE